MKQGSIFSTVKRWNIVINKVLFIDLKPENLLYSDTTEDAQLKVADFGLARLLNEQ